MTIENLIILFLLLLVLVLFISEIRHTIVDRRAKAVIDSLNGRVNSLGDVVEALVKLQQVQQAQRVKEPKENEK